VGTRSFTLEELHRMLWQQNKRAYLKLAREGYRSVQFHQEQFEREDAEKAQQAVHRNRGSIR